MLVFISKCEGLEMITFESIELSVSLMSLMGKALAASGSGTEILLSPSFHNEFSPFFFCRNQVAGIQIV